MSKETMQWLNQNTLIGFTDERGHAWHYRASDQGQEPNHYPGAIPLEDVRRRLFHWEAVEGTVTATVITDDGVLSVTDPTRKAIVRPDTEAILGLFKTGYVMHQPSEWLIDNVAYLLDDTLSCGSAGLLRGGAVAWVQIEVPETITTPEGVAFRPHLTAATSFDGSLATTYGRAVTATVCDNTLSLAIRSMGDQKLKVRHSRYSNLKLESAREALAIVHETADEFSKQVADLCAITVTDKQWAKFLDEVNPIPKDDGRAKTIAQGKRDRLTGMYDHDARVAPWRGSAFGVVQAINTWAHHEQSFKGDDRGERNMTLAVMGPVRQAGHVHDGLAGAGAGVGRMHAAARRPCGGASAASHSTRPKETR